MTLSERVQFLIDELVDPDFGVITSLIEVPRRPGSPQLFHYAATSASTAPLGFRENFSTGSGAATSRDRAKIKAIGECIERYSGAIQLGQSSGLCASSELASSHTKPKDYAQPKCAEHSEWESPWPVFTDHSLVGWTVGKSLKSGLELLVPSQFANIPYRSKPGEVSVAQTISTGLACHSSYEDAVLSAICEVIERDAFTITWQRMVQPPEIKLDVEDAEIRYLFSELERNECKCQIFDISLDHCVSVVLALLISENPHRPALTVAASAHPNPKLAIIGALEELAHTHRYVCVLTEEAQDAGEATLQSPDDVTEQKHHLLYWGERSRLENVHFITETNSSIRLSDFLNRETPDTKHILDHLHSMGHEAVIVDLTSPDIKKLDLSVVKAIVPGLHPLFLGHQNRFRGGKRLWQVPEQIDQNCLTVFPVDNLQPHPFP